MRIIKLQEFAFHKIFATTHKENFHIGTRVKALTFKDGEKSEAVRLFFVTAINKLQILFKEYLTNATDKLPELSIMLPVKDDGTIDYDYMEIRLPVYSNDNIDYTYITAFIKVQEKLSIKNVIDWKNKIINTSKKCKSKPRLKDVVCSEAISLCYWPAPQGAGFHFVQATMPLTRCSP